MSESKSFATMSLGELRDELDRVFAERKQLQVQLKELNKRNSFAISYYHAVRHRINDLQQLPLPGTEPINLSDIKGKK